MIAAPLPAIFWLANQVRWQPTRQLGLSLQESKEVVDEIGCNPRHTQLSAGGANDRMDGCRSGGRLQFWMR